MPSNRNHPIHEYFSLMDEDTPNPWSKCKDCGRVIASLNSTNLSSHLSNHLATYAAYLPKVAAYKAEKDQKKKKAEDGTKQLTIIESFRPREDRVPLDIDNSKVAELNDDVAKMIVIDGLPFHVSSATCYLDYCNCMHSKNIYSLHSCMVAAEKRVFIFNLKCHHNDRYLI